VSGHRIDAMRAMLRNLRLRFRPSAQTAAPPPMDPELASVQFSRQQTLIHQDSGYGSPFTGDIPINPPPPPPE